jgi:hypothetical protein
MKKLLLIISMLMFSTFARAEMHPKAEYIDKLQKRFFK